MAVTIALDIGTTSMRGVLFDRQGGILHTVSRQTSPRFIDQVRIEQDPRQWRSALSEILQECSTHVRSHALVPEALSVTSFRSPVFPIDREGRPLANAIMWQDRRTNAMCDELEDQQSLVFSKTGLRITSVFSGIKMRWFYRHRPELLPQVHKFIGVHEYILYLLTGSLVTDHSVASRSNLFDLHSLQYDDELLGIFGVDREHLCEVIPPGAVAGLCTTDLIEQRVFDGLPVISAGGDQQCAALGLGVVKPGVMEANTGTGSYVIGFADRPMIDPEQRIFCNVGAIPGTYIMEAGILASGTIYRWFGEQFYDLLPGEQSVFARIDQEISASAPGANGVVMLPYLTGSGAPRWDPDATGMFYHLNLSTGRGDLARSILEGIAVEIAENITLMEQFIGRAHCISVAGGMTKFDLYNRIQAAVYELPVIRYASNEATAIGAWLSAGVTLGHFSDHEQAFDAYLAGTSATRFTPDEQWSGIYRGLRRKKERLYRALKEEGL